MHMRLDCAVRGSLEILAWRNYLSLWDVLQAALNKSMDNQCLHDSYNRNENLRSQPRGLI